MSIDFSAFIGLSLKLFLPYFTTLIFDALAHMIHLFYIISYMDAASSFLGDSVNAVTRAVILPLPNSI